MRSRAASLIAFALPLAAVLLLAAPQARAADTQYTCTCTAKESSATCPAQPVSPPQPVSGKTDDEAQKSCSAYCHTKLGDCLDSFSFSGKSELITNTNCLPGYTCLANPLDRCPSNTDPKAACHTLTLAALASNIIKTGVGIVGALALLVFIYGGLRWLTSGGEPAKIQAGKDAMKWAAIGLVVIFSSYALVSFVFKAFTG